MKISPKVWKNGEFIDWDDARIHVMSHVVNYGSSVFEGIRCYNTIKGSAVFRLTEHMQRLVNSAKIYRMDFPYDRRNALRRDGRADRARADLTIVTFVRSLFRGLDEDKPAFGVNPFPESDRYLYRDMAVGQIPRRRSYRDRHRCLRLELDADHFKLAARDGEGRCELYEFAAHQDGSPLGGFSEGIALDDRGMCPKARAKTSFWSITASCITPPLGASVLPGITRDSVIQIARDMGIEVVETSVQRAALYLADEVFLTGTAAEITPIRSIDKITVGRATAAKSPQLCKKNSSTSS